MSKPHITREALTVAKAASTDPVRANLRGVHLRPDGATEATDGHVMMRWTPSDAVDLADFPRLPGIVPDELPGIPPAGVILPLELATDLAKGIARASKANKGRLPILNGAVMAECNGALRFVCTDLDTTTQHVGRPLEGPFPDTDRIAPKGAPKLRIAFDAALLKRVCEAAIAVSDTEQHALVFDFRTDVGAAAFRVNGEAGQLSGLIMPLMLPEGERLPGKATK